MNAITIWQPYAWAIVAGLKAVENRSWAPPTKVYSERLLIHAGSTAAPREDFFAVAGLVERVGGRMPDVLPRGAIVGAVTLRRALMIEDLWEDEQAKSAAVEPWATGPWCWLLEDPIVFDKPIPVRGYQRVWSITCAPTRRNCLDAIARAS